MVHTAGSAAVLFSGQCQAESSEALCRKQKTRYHKQRWCLFNPMTSRSLKVTTKVGDFFFHSRLPTETAEP